MDNRQAYERSYGRIRELVDPQVATVEVPTCPGWTVQDVVGHLASLLAAASSSDPKEAFSQGWAERELEARKGRSLEDHLVEWAERLENADPVFESPLGTVAVSDALAHEQDIRTALNRPGARDDENITPSVEMALTFVEQKIEAEDDVPAFRVVTDDLDRQVGDGEPVATLHTSTFELFRAIQGRRTVDQVRAMKWDGDPEPILSVFFIFGPTEQKVEE